jgi:hypothetical protein
MSEVTLQLLEDEREVILEMVRRLLNPEIPKSKYRVRALISMMIIRFRGFARVFCGRATGICFKFRHNRKE